MSRKVLLDVDPGCDDAAAIAMAIGAPEIDLVGISTVQGNTDIDNATKNTLAILELFNRTDVPVARGAERPFIRDPITAEHVHGPNGIRGPMPEPRNEPVDEHATDFLLQQVDEFGSDLTICAVGPQTNIALALSKRPNLVDEIDELYVMGGAAMASTGFEYRFNFLNDPESARKVFQEASPKMVGINVTTRAPVSFDFIAGLADRDPPFDVIREWLDYPEEISSVPAVDGKPIDGLILHDAVVVADVISPGIIDFEEYPAVISTEEGPAAGRVFVDYHEMSTEEPNASIGINVDADEFHAVFEKVLSHL